MERERTRERMREEERERERDRERERERERDEERERERDVIIVIESVAENAFLPFEWKGRIRSAGLIQSYTRPAGAVAQDTKLENKEIAAGGWAKKICGGWKIAFRILLNRWGIMIRGASADQTRASRWHLGGIVVASWFVRACRTWRSNSVLQKA